jgi:hypothetical protein
MATAKTAAAAKAPEYPYIPSRRRTERWQPKRYDNGVGVRAYSDQSKPPVGPEAFVPSRDGAIATNRAAGHQALSGQAKGDFVDFLLRGRGWIVVIALLLGGIVFLNVSALQQGRETSAASDHANQLKQQNAQLRLTAGDLASSGRIEHAASSLGYSMPDPGAVHYVRTDPGADIRGATAALTRPAPEGQQQAASGSRRGDNNGSSQKQHLANSKSPLAGTG